MALPSPRLNKLQARTRVSCAERHCRRHRAECDQRTGRRHGSPRLARGRDRAFRRQGQRVLRFDLSSQRPTDEELLPLLLGRSGKLRAPALRCGTRLIVGYNQALLPLALG